MKPIGYWLNRTDRAITTAMNQALTSAGITRTGWQILNVAGLADCTTDHVLDVLAANADRYTLLGTIGDLLADGLLYRPGPNLLARTPSGEDLFARADALIAGFRERSLTGISIEEYQTAVRVLERMTANLETS
ncbi:MarR family winged helix-turn-helix transcriptional regulator [Longispora albida]|uniref:MarR family winged helix-turn-helix transcriptional regulator n=1 Tax=Longispora albida TaxID=203523 RepID=UPI000369AEC4|nr:hypothetical protein [Longispora albida]